MRSGCYFNRKLLKRCSSIEKYNAKMRRANYLIRKRYFEAINMPPEELMKEILGEQKAKEGKIEKEIKAGKKEQENKEKGKIEKEIKAGKNE